MGRRVTWIEEIQCTKLFFWSLGWSWLYDYHKAQEVVILIILMNLGLVKFITVQKLVVSYGINVINCLKSILAGQLAGSESDCQQGNIFPEDNWDNLVMRSLIVSLKTCVVIR